MTINEAIKYYQKAQNENQKAQEAAKAAANIASAINLAASYNVLVVARNAIYNELTTAPEKYNKPMHYKVMQERLNAICGDRFNVYTSYSTVYLRYHDAAGTREVFICDTNNDNTLNLERPYIKDRKPELTLNQIKKEVKQAAKDAEKLRKAAEELYNKSEAMQAKYNSYVKHLMPYSNKYNLEDKYRLF